jgi:hypothetical protein
MVDIEKLSKALDDESNESLLNFTTKKIREIIVAAINELNLEPSKRKMILDKLKGYRYVDEMNELKNGTYLRWIPLHNPDHLELTTGAIFCDLNITNDGIYLICKNYGNHRKRFQINMGECLIFRRLTDQELVLLSALDHLSK